MIFVTVGAQMPFDRMVQAVDRWALKNGRDDVFAQVGATESPPTHIKWTRFLSPRDFEERYRAAKVIVAHAGTGSIITALQLGKPILILPRRAILRETRNDHQVATAEQFRRYPAVVVAWDEKELAERLVDVDRLVGQSVVGQHASAELLETIRTFIAGA